MRLPIFLTAGILAASSFLQAQQADIARSVAHTRDVPVYVELPTLNNHLRSLAGMTVRVRRASIQAIVSPQAFVVEDRRDFGFQYWLIGSPRYKALVVTDRPIASLRKGVPVTLTGRALTYFDATQTSGHPELLLDEELEDDFDRGVVLMADLVTTPAGIELYAR